MLGVQRPGVTLAVQALEADGLIAARRGRIGILNRAKQEESKLITHHEGPLGIRPLAIARAVEPAYCAL